MRVTRWHGHGALIHLCLIGNIPKDTNFVAISKFKTNEARTDKPSKQATCKRVLLVRRLLITSRDGS